MLAALSVDGWTQGLSFDYRAARPTVEVTLKHAIAIAVQDRRSYVLSGNRPESYVGLRRGAFGIPIDVGTQSGQGLAADVATALVQGLKFSRIEATSIAVPPQAPREQVIHTIRESGKAQTLLLTIGEWKTDSMVNTDVHYRLRLELLDRNADVIALDEIEGMDQVGGHANGPQVIAGKLERLFKGRIIAALEGTPLTGIPEVQTTSGVLSQQIRCRVGTAEPKVMTRLSCSQNDGVIIQ